MLKNGTPASPATARASSVLPVPGGPAAARPSGCGRRAAVLVGVLQEVDDLDQLGLRLVDAGHVVEYDQRVLAVVGIRDRALEVALHGGADGGDGRDVADLDLVEEERAVRDPDALRRPGDPQAVYQLSASRTIDRTSSGSP